MEKEGYTREISLEEALAEAGNSTAFPYELSYELSRLYLGPSRGAKPDMDLGEVNEARWFGMECEIHIKRSGEGWKAWKTEDPEEFIELKWKLLNRYGRSLTMHRCLGFDEDGQAYTEKTRLVKWEGGAENAV